MASELKTVALSSLRPNPHRDLEQFPLLPEKVEALKESIAAVGFWEGVIARPAKDGYEIAFGHHRVEAARQALGAEARVPLIVRDLADVEMYHFMARENLEENGWDFFHTWIQDVRAAVRGLGAGVLEFTTVDEKTRVDAVRKAPSFQRGCGEAVVPTSELYTAQTLAEFMRRTEKDGKPEREILTALDVLEMWELAGTKPKDSRMQGLDHTKTREVAVRAKAVAAIELRAALEREQEKERKRAAAEREKDRACARKQREYEAKVKREGEEQARKEREALEANRRKLEAEREKEEKARKGREQQAREDAAEKAAASIKTSIDKLESGMSATDLQTERKMDKTAHRAANAPNAKPTVAVDLEGRVVRIREQIERLALPAAADGVLALLYDPSHGCRIAEIRKLEAALIEKISALTAWRRQVQLCIKKRSK